jgi:hypothetical protein
MGRREPATGPHRLATTASDRGAAGRDTASVWAMGHYQGEDRCSTSPGLIRSSPSPKRDLVGAVPRDRERPDSDRYFVVFRASVAVIAPHDELLAILGIALHADITRVGGWVAATADFLRSAVDRHQTAEVVIGVDQGIHSASVSDIGILLRVIDDFDRQCAWLWIAAATAWPMRLALWTACASAEITPGDGATTPGETSSPAGVNGPSVMATSCVRVLVAA